MHPGAIVLALVGPALVLAWRIRETQRPMTVRRIVIPPIGMSSGLSMFLFLPAMRVPPAWAAGAFLLGAVLFAYPLVWTSKLVVEGEQIFLKRSKAFLFILIGLIAVRLALRAYVERYISYPQTAALFFLLAFGMIVRWRVGMYRDYQRLRRSLRARDLTDTKTPAIANSEMTEERPASSP